MMKFRFTLIFAPTVLPLSADLIFSEDFSGGDGGIRIDRSRWSNVPVAL
jgi:hypothetical protein